MTNRLVKLFSSFLIVALVIHMFPPNILCAQEAKIRIIKDNAVVRLKPNSDSAIIRKLPLGAEFKVRETIGEWIVLELPPDDNGIIIVGYVHKSFVEIREGLSTKQSENEIIAKKPSIKTEPTKEIMSNENMLWRRDLNKAKSKRSTGAILSVLGAIVFAGFTVLAVTRPVKEYGFLNITSQEKLNMGYVAGGAIGLTTLIVGLAVYFPADGMVYRLENEGREKGYITLGLLPKYKAVGVQISVSF